MQNHKHQSSLLKRAAEFFLAITLAGMVIAVFVNVVLRYGFDTGIVFYEELSRLLFVWMVCIGAALVFAENEHLGFDMLTERLRAGGRKHAIAVCKLLSRIAIAICLVLVIKGAGDCGHAIIQHGDAFSVGVNGGGGIGDGTIDVDRAHD
jgi:TRAP-type transport system small permease protein